MTANSSNYCGPGIVTFECIDFALAMNNFSITLFHLAQKVTKTTKQKQNNNKVSEL